jgi:hypothetical protein
LAGVSRQRWSIELTCPNCGCLVEFGENDLAVSVFWGLDPHHFKVDCPVTGCDEEMKIIAATVPKLIRERVFSAYQAAKTPR